MSDLVPYDEIRRELEMAESVDVLGEAKARIEAATTYARRQRLRPAVLEGVELSRRCERRIGALLAETIKAHRPASEVSVTTTLPDGITRDQSSRWQALARLNEETFEGFLADRRAADEEAYLAALLALATDNGNSNGAHVANNSGDNEWYTPQEYIDAAHSVMDGVDLDPASTAVANEVVGATVFYAAEDDGLSKNWKGRVWMNPPYARPLIDAFCGKLAESYAAGDVTQAITLTNNATETGWFHALAEVGAAMAFPRQRVRFWHPEKESAPLQGQACVYLGENVEAFRREFVLFGFTVTL